MDKSQELGFRLDEVARLYTRRFEQRTQTLSFQLAQCKALVLIAENAKPLLKLIWSVIGDTYVEALQGVSIDEIETIVKVLTRVHSNLSHRRCWVASHAHPLVIPAEPVRQRTERRKRCRRESRPAKCCPPAP